MQLNNKTYDFLKWVVTIFLPAVGAGYFGLSQVWEGVPYAIEVVGTTSVLATFFGALIGISSKSYKKSDAANFDGELRIEEVDGENGPKEIYSFVLNGDLDELPDKDTLSIKVSPRRAQ